MALLLALAGCQSGSSDSSDDASSDLPSKVIVSLPPEEPGIRMSFLQRRSQEGTQQAAVRIINITDEALTVRRVGLDWPGYELSRPERARVAAGQTLDLDVSLPEPACSVEIDDEAAVGFFETPDRTVRRPIDEAGMRFLSRIWESDCATRAVDRMVRLTYVVPTPDRADEGVGLRMTRQGSAAEAVGVDSIQGSVLFDLAVDEPGDGLAPGQRSTVVPIRFSPGRCDEHARSQATQAFLFRVWLTIGDDPNLVAIVAEPDREAQARLLAMLDAACGDATQH